jgi:curved DNA-binding protein CbpA
LSRLNEAFAVLGKPNLRADYDAVLFHDEIRARSRRQRSLERRRKLAANLIVGSVLLIVLAQVAVLGYMAVDRFPALLDRFYPAASPRASGLASAALRRIACASA